MPSPNHTFRLRGLDGILLGTLMLLAFLQYANTLNHGYAWDDSIAITQNPRVQAGASGIPDHFQFRDRAELADFNGYRPIPLSTFSLEVELFGPDPQAAHRVQVLLFALLCGIVFWVLRRLFPGFHPFYAFLATLLFAIHPLHVEVVANLKSRDELLSLLFGVLALERFVLFVRLAAGDKAVLGGSTGSARAGSSNGGTSSVGATSTGTAPSKTSWLPLLLSGALSFVYLLLAMLSKENAVSFLGIMLVAGWIFAPGRKGFIWGGGLVLAQVLAIVGTYVVLTGRLPGATPEETTLGFVENIVVSNSHAVDMNLFERLMNSGHLLLRYLGEFFYPVDLVYTSGYNQIPVLEGFSLLGLLGLLLLVGAPLAMLWLWFRRRVPALTFGFFLFYGSLLLFLHVLFPIADTMGDRFMFTPSLGLCWMLAAGLPLLLGWNLGENPLVRLGLVKESAGKTNASSAKAKDKALLGGYLAVLILLVPLFTITTFQRNPIWRSNFDLFSSDLPKLENCGRAHYFYASALREKNNFQPTLADLEEAVVHLRRAAEISPYLFYARLELGQLLNQLKRDVEAVAVLEEAVALFPEHQDSYFYLGRAQYLAGNYAGAIGSFQSALAIRGDDAQSMELLARAYNQNREFEKGLGVVRDALQSFPSEVMILDAYSDLLYDSGQKEASFNPVFQVLEIQPNDPRWWKKLIGRYQLIGDDSSAAVYYQQAVQRGVL